MTIGERIGAWRKARGLSQKELAAKVGVTPAAVSYWEGEGEKGEPSSVGPGNPTFENLEKVLVVLKLSMAKFYNDVPKRKAS